MDLTGFEKQVKPEATSLDELLELHAGLSFEKQLIFGDVIGGRSWQFDMTTGSITFGNELSYPIQIIGSLSFGDSSWMWGWANHQSGIPESLLEHSNELKNMGQTKGINELVDGHFNVDEGFEHVIGMIACGVFETSSYYCANYGQGTLVMTIDSDEIPSVDTNNFEKIMTNFPQLIGSIALNHKAAFKNYLIDRGFELKIEEQKITGAKNGKVVTGEFDELSRLTGLNGQL